MPPRGRSQKPPEAMTWGRALPVLAVAVIFDLMRAFFEMFWFFGPAIATWYCTEKISGSLFGLVGTKTAATVCGGVATAAGFFGAPVIEVFGVIMAGAVGILGFLVLGMWIFTTNSRLFRVNASAPLLFVMSFGVSELPFIGTLPAFSVVLWRLYSNQIQIERAALQKWNRDNAAQIAAQRQAQQQQAAYLMQANIMQANADDFAEDDIY